MTAFVKFQHFLKLHAELHEQKLLCCVPVLIPVRLSSLPLYVSVSKPLVEYWRLFSTPTWLTGTPSSSSQPATPAPHFVTFEQMFTCRLIRKRKWSELVEGKGQSPLSALLTRNSFPFAVVWYPFSEANSWRLNSKPVFGSTTAQFWHRGN